MTDKRQISKSRLITTKHNTKNESFSCTHPSRNESFEQRRADKKCARDTQTIIASQWLFKYFICFDDIWFWYGLGVRVWIYVAGAFLKEKKKNNNSLQFVKRGTWCANVFEMGFVAATPPAVTWVAVKTFPLYMRHFPPAGCLSQAFAKH